MMNFTKKLVFSLLALVFVGSTYFLDQKTGVVSATSEIPDVVILEKGAGAKVEKSKNEYFVQSGESGQLVLLIRGVAVLRTKPKTSFSLAFVGDEVSLQISLQDGQIWLNTRQSGYSSTMEADGIFVSLQPGVYDIQKTSEQLRLAAYRRSAVLNILGSELLLPEGRQMTVALARLKKDAGTIKKLRSSKLLKEFPYFEIEPATDWVKENQALDDSFAIRLHEKITEGIRQEGPKLGTIAHTLENFKVTLTFDEKKKQALRAKNLFDYFDSAAYAILIGNIDMAEKWLSEWKNASAGELQNPYFQKELRVRRSRLARIEPTDNLFTALRAIREITPQKSAQRIALSLQDIQDLEAATSGAEGEGRVALALRKFNALVENAKGEELFFNYLAFADFLARHPEFQREEFFKGLSILGKAHLAMLTNQEEADDERQFFISEKIKSIQAMKYFMEKGDIPFQEGRRVILLLASDIESLRPNFSDAAVLVYFDSQLRELAPFLGFLRSQVSANLRGSFEADYREYIESQHEFAQIRELLDSAQGGISISSFRREELAESVSTDFSALGASDIKIMLPDLEGDSRVKIVSALLEEKTFSGVYDTQGKVLSDLVIGEEKIESAVRLENFKKFFLVKMGKASLEAGETIAVLTESRAEESLLERATKSALMEELKKMDISAEDRNLGLEDLDTGVLHVRLAVISQGTDAKVFSFDVGQKLSVVTNLKVQTVLGEIPVNDAFALRELPLKVEQIYSRAVFERQKEEELKKLGVGTSTEALPIEGE